MLEGEINTPETDDGVCSFASNGKTIYFTALNNPIWPIWEQKFTFLPVRELRGIRLKC
jgi:hypothetical protein